VTGFAQLLQRRFAVPLGTQGAEYIDTIVNGTRHMDRLISDLLAFSRVGRGDSGMVEVNTQDILAQAEYQLAAQIRETQARITHDPLPTVRGTPIELLQLLQNLIGNALKFRAPGVHPAVHVSASRDHEFWVFSVRDNGIGIEPEHRERIFEMFQRLHGAETYEGTGIGLAICRKIAQHHGGRIWVQSNPGQGSTFSFTLPAQ
jgi:signal transduction histidine kinase